NSPSLKRIDKSNIWPRAVGILTSFRLCGRYKRLQNKRLSGNEETLLLNPPNPRGQTGGRFRHRAGRRYSTAKSDVGDKQIQIVRRARSLSWYRCASNSDVCGERR